MLAIKRLRSLCAFVKTLCVTLWFSKFCFFTTKEHEVHHKGSQRLIGNDL